MKLLLLTCLLAPFPALAQVRIAGRGQPPADIVVTDALSQQISAGATLSDSTGSAVRELLDAVEKMIGVRLPVRGESTPADAQAVSIYLGDVAANRALLKGRPALQPEEFLIHTEPRALHIAGGDFTENRNPVDGTYFGVCDLLEREWGVRWLFPGPLGEVMPKRETLELPALDRRGQPAAAKRVIRNTTLSRAESYEKLLAELGTTVDAWRASQDAPATALWLRRHQMGGRVEIEAGHSFGGFYEKYGKEHPDFFALQPDGTRVQHGDYERLCKSNPALWDFVAQLRVAQLRAHPGQKTISICPNDGGANKWCMCEQCRALDPPEAPKLLNNRGLIDPATGQPFPEYPALTDRVFTFYNEVARRVGKELPDRLLVGYAYSLYKTPPVRLTHLEPNLIVGFVGLDHDAIDRWSKLASHLFIRPNDLTPRVDLGLPRNHAAFFAESVKFCLDRHALGFDFDSWVGNWSSDGLDCYILTKALTDASLDARAAIADYCRAAYGPGAPAMERYYAQLEKISTAVREDTALRAWGGDNLRLLKYYTPEAIAALTAQLAEARSAIPASDAACLARLAMAADSVEYARRLIAFLPLVKSPKSPEYAARLQAVMELYRAKVLSQSLQPLHSYRMLRFVQAKGKLPPE